MSTRLILSILMVLSMATPSLTQTGEVKILNHREGAFINSDCKKNKTCELRKVEYFVEDYGVSVEGDSNYGTRFFARYETKSVKDLEKFVFVQFIKGCHFASYLSADRTETGYEFVYPRDAGAIDFKFLDWTIDSYDLDPAYSTFDSKSRFFGYRWNTVPDSFSKDTEKLYGKAKPKTASVYIVDHPGTAFYMNERAHNISLQFRTCIYRAKDVPRKVEYSNVNFAKPLSCFEWDSSFIYNHSAKEFESQHEISPSCK